MKRAICVLLLLTAPMLAPMGCSTDSHLEAMEKSSAAMAASAQAMQASFALLSALAARLTTSVEHLEKRLGFTLDQFDNFMSQVRIKQEPAKTDDIQSFIDKIEPGEEGGNP